jgi:hypothetical protein
MAAEGFITVTPDALQELVTVSDTLARPFFASGRLRANEICVAEAPTALFAAAEPQAAPPRGHAGGGPRSVRAAEAEVGYDAVRANARHGALLGLGRARTIQEVQVWFAAVCQNYLAGRPNLNPLLVLIGPSGSGKSALTRWMAEAFHPLQLLPIDPLRHGGPAGPAAIRPPPAPAAKRRRTAAQAPGRAARPLEEGRDAEDEEADDREPEQRSGVGSDGAATVGHLLLDNRLGRPRVLLLQDVDLFSLDLLRAVFMMVAESRARVRAAGVVLHLTPEEAYARPKAWAAPGRRASSAGPGTAGPASLFKFLKSFGALTVNLRAATVAECLEQLRARPSPGRSLPGGLPVASFHLAADEAERLALAARGDRRQLRLLRAWKLGPRAPQAAGERGPESELDAAILLVRGAAPCSAADPGAGASRPCSLERARELCAHMRIHPARQAVEVLRAWMHCAEPHLAPPEAGPGGRASGASGTAAHGRPGGGAFPEAAPVVPCSEEALHRIMLLACQIRETQSSQRAGTFRDHRHVSELPPHLQRQIFGNVREIAAETTSWRERLLSPQLDRDQPPPPPTPPPPAPTTVAPAAAGAPGTGSSAGAAGHAAEGPPETGASGRAAGQPGPGGRKRAVAHIATDAQGFLDLGGMARKKARVSSRPAALPAPAMPGGSRTRGAGTATDTVPPARVSEEGRRLLRCSAELAWRLSDHDALVGSGGLGVDGHERAQSEVVWAAQLCARGALTELLGDQDMPLPEGRHVLQWTLPSRWLANPAPHLANPHLFAPQMA